mgnify:CR=1 FL=1
MLRQMEAQLPKGMSIEEACRQAGGLKLDQAKRLRELEKENSRLKRLVADLTLDNQILKEADKKNF